MRKEVFWAIMAGIIFGLIVGFGIWRINSSLKSKNNPFTPPTPPPIKKTSLSELKIAIDKPENEDVLTEDSLNISGITKNSAWVVVSNENTDILTQADTKGVFSKDIELTPGVNQIKITAFDNDLSQAEAQLITIYSSLFKKNLASPNPSSKEATGESAIRKRVEEKVAEVINHPKAFLGTVTDITDSSIQIKSIEGDIKQISATSDSTNVVDNRDDSNKEVKLTDIAIGDFLVAMGYKGSNNVLISQRILITDPIKNPQLNATIGKVASKNSGTLTVAINDSETRTISASYLTDIKTFKEGKEMPATISNIANGDIIIFVTDNNNKAPKVRSIFLIQKDQK